MSWKPVVKTGSDPRWYDNALRFATKDEALSSARDLAGRWTLVTDYDAHESDEEVNCGLEAGQ